MAAHSAFGRPRTYPAFSDKRMFLADYAVPHDAVAQLEKSGSANLRTWLDQNRTNLIPPDYKFYPRGKATANDPRVLYFVLDALANSQERQYIRTHDLGAYLQNLRPQYYWTPISVGRVVAGIHAAVQSCYAGLEDGLMNEYESDDRFMPFGTSRDTKSRFYVIDPKGGNEGRLWLMAARRKMYDICMNQMRADAMGRATEYFGTGNAAADTYLLPEHGGWLLGCGPVRDKVSYEAQLTGLGSVEDQPEPQDASFLDNKGLSAAINAPKDGSHVRIGG